MKRLRSLFILLMLLTAIQVSAQTYTAVPADYWENRGGGNSFTDGTLIFSTRKRTNYDGEFRYYKDGKFTYSDMPSGEVCVGLYLNEQQEVTDIFPTRSYGSGYPLNGSYEVGEVIDGDTELSKYYTSGTYENGVKYTYIEDAYSVENNVEKIWRKIFYRTRTLNVSKVTSVVIPATVSYGGVEYKVTEVDFGGFIYLKNSCNPVELCTKKNNPDGTYDMTETGHKYYRFICVGHNDYLQNVTFLGNNLKKIGAFAFTGCDGLTSITIPYNVEEIGMDVFYMCKNLRTVNFQTNASTGKSNLTTIGDYAFAHLYQLTSVVLPEGFVSLGTYGFAYNSSLQSITLPSTMTTAGAHFLCNCSSLPMLTIPANLTNLDGAFLHGCDNLKELYLLGYPKNLQLNSGDYDAWEGNHADCTGHVGDKVDAVEVYYASTYEGELGKGGSNDAWQTLLWSSTAEAWGIKANSLDVVTRDFTAGKWVTACFPKGVSASDLSSKFGSGTKVAKFVKAVRLDDAPDPVTGKSLYMYNLIFEMQDYSTSGVPKDLPVMFCSEKDVVGYEMWNVADMTGTGASNFIAGWTKDHNENTTVTAENEDGDNDDIVSQISMKSNYVSRALQPWDFYFSYNNGADGEAKFYRVNKLNDTSAGPTRCWWTVTVGGVVNSSASAKTNAMFFDEASGIDHPEDVVRIGINGVYDTQGRRLDIPASELPHGLFIVNGQKVLIK